MSFPVRYNLNDPDGTKSINTGPIPLWGGFTIERLWTTPEIARELMSRNIRKQRTIKKRQLEMIKRALLGSTFRAGYLWNGDLILIDRHGNVLDGQHRLTAVIQTEIAADLVVLRGLDPEVFSAIDNATRRTGGDTLNIAGIPNSNAVSAACHLLIRYELKMIRGMGNYQIYAASTVEIEQTAQKYPDLAKSVSFALCAAPICRSPSVPGFCHFMFSRISKDFANQFIHKLATGEMLRTNDSIYVLRSKLDKRVGTRDSDHVVHLLFKTWNLWRKEKTVKTISIRDEEPLPILM